MYILYIHTKLFLNLQNMSMVIPQHAPQINPSHPSSSISTTGLHLLRRHRGGRRFGHVRRLGLGVSARGLRLARQALALHFFQLLGKWLME